jgi:hypothetical protein
MPPSVIPLALTIRAAGATDIGRVRKHNEDTVLLRDDLQLYIVADGAGGHNAGNVASALATTAIANFFENTQKDVDSIPEYDEFGFSTGARRLARAIQRANRDIIEIAKSSMRHRGMGTTVVAAWARPELGVIHLGHVGDSRCYRHRRRPARAADARPLALQRRARTPAGLARCSARAVAQERRDARARNGRSRPRGRPVLQPRARRQVSSSARTGSRTGSRSWRSPRRSSRRARPDDVVKALSAARASPRVRTTSRRSSSSATWRALGTTTRGPGLPA